MGIFKSIFGDESSKFISKFQGTIDKINSLEDMPFTRTVVWEPPVDFASFESGYKFDEQVASRVISAAFSCAVHAGFRGTFYSVLNLNEG